jgi:xanthine dehydrogenase accessory factor
MTLDLLALAVELSERREPFAVATVVRVERPTSAKPGAKAIIRADGTVAGWIGGACAEPTVVREALACLRDGQPRFIALIGEGGRGPGRTEGVLEYPMTCHSGGTLEIYVEPVLPKPELALIGHGPVVETLARLGAATRFTVIAIDPAVVGDELSSVTFTPSTSVVVASHGDIDEIVLARVLASAAGYVSLVASRKRAAAVVDRLRRRGLGADRIGRLRAPAGLDIGALTPPEIAVSILAEIIQVRRSPKSAAAEAGAALPTTATDPVCGMLVDVATAAHRSESPSGIVYFCCLGCKDAFDRA